jgi:predicted TIM-barrel fold metal-dependent hydrolase
LLWGSTDETLCELSSEIKTAALGISVDSKPPSEYFKDHFVITTSGMSGAPALHMSLAVLGADRLLFAADYPFEDMPAAVASIDAMQLAPRIANRFAAGTHSVCSDCEAGLTDADH